MSIVINYQQLKLFIIAIRNLNSNFTPSNRLHMDGNRLPAVIEHFNSNLKPEEEVTTLGEREVMLRKVLQVCLICLKNLF